MLVCVSGLAGSGKDTIAAILLHHKVVGQRYAFADPIKQTCNALFGWDERHSFGDLKEVETTVSMEFLHDNSQSFIEQCGHYGLDTFGLRGTDILDKLSLELVFNMNAADGTLTTSPREVYQLFGTEVGRMQINTDLWTIVAPSEDVCIPDLRFPNEREWLAEKNGYHIHVVKDDAAAVRAHVSENYIEELANHADFIADNNGSLIDLETIMMGLFSIPDDAPRLYTTVPEITGEDVLNDRLSELVKAQEQACSFGNWNFDQYMHGYANGIILAVAVMRGETDVDFKAAPDEWLSERSTEAVPKAVSDFQLSMISAVSDPEPGCEAEFGVNADHE